MFTYTKILNIFRTLHRSILVLFAVVAIVTLIHFSITNIVAETLSKSQELREIMQFSSAKLLNINDFYQRPITTKNLPVLRGVGTKIFEFLLESVQKFNTESELGKVNESQ